MSALAVIALASIPFLAFAVGVVAYLNAHVSDANRDRPWLKPRSGGYQRSTGKSKPPTPRGRGAASRSDAHGRADK